MLHFIPTVWKFRTIYITYIFGVYNFKFFITSLTLFLFITTKLLDFVHRPDFYKPENTTFRKLDLFPSSGGGGGAPTLQKNQKLDFPQASPNVD
jgi:hypothetical protein